MNLFFTILYIYPFSDIGGFLDTYANTLSLKKISFFIWELCFQCNTVADKQELDWMSGAFGEEDASTQMSSV